MGGGSPVGGSPDRLRSLTEKRGHCRQGRQDPRVALGQSPSWQPSSGLAEAGPTDTDTYPLVLHGLLCLVQHPLHLLDGHHLEGWREGRLLRPLGAFGRRATWFSGPCPLVLFQRSLPRVLTCADPAGPSH